MNFELIKYEIEERLSEFISIRREIHMNPETGMEEFKTTDLIIKTLESFGVYEIEKIGETGVVAIIRGNGEKCVAIRADIDALHIEEKTNLEYASKLDGIMHACGHDIHTISLLGSAYILNRHRDEIKGIVKLIFQPAEEQGIGAKYMIENGALENPKPVAIFGLHTWPDVEAGKIFHRHGKMGAASDRFEIKIIGKGGHAAHPEKTVDPIVIAGNVIVMIQNIVSRELSPLDSAVVSFAAINGGNVSNKIPSEVELKGSIRTLSEDTREYVHRRIEEVVENVSKSMRGSSEVKIHKGVPVSYNDRNVSVLIERACREVLGDENYIENPEPSMGSEDFAYYSDYVSSAMYRLGVGFKDRENAPLHSDKFMANEKAIPTGILSMVAVAEKLLNEL